MNKQNVKNTPGPASSIGGVGKKTSELGTRRLGLSHKLQGWMSLSQVLDMTSLEQMRKQIGWNMLAKVSQILCRERAWRLYWMDFFSSLPSEQKALGTWGIEDIYVLNEGRISKANRSRIKLYFCLLCTVWPWKMFLTY